MKVKYYLFFLGILFCMPIYGQQLIKIKGTVKDATGPLPGVSVNIKGTNNGTSSDLDGNYVISAKSTDILIFSYVGYKSVEKAVEGKTSFNVTLVAENNQLDEIVVIGYGTAKKKDLTGSVASISAADIVKTPVANVAQALQGKLAGVNVTAQDGRPGAEISIRVRGGGSITQSNDPLFVVDGFIVGSISNIPGSQIERIDVLKDAAATAIYGASGANGVVIVTTKSGKAGKTTVTYDAYSQINTPTKYTAVMNGYDYLLYNWSYAQAIGDSYANAWEKMWLIGNEFKGSNTAGIDQYKNVASENFSKQVYKSSFTHNQDFNISSGTEKTKYIFSVNHINQDGMKLNSGYKRSNVSFKLDQKLGEKLTFNLNTRYVQEDTHGDESTGSSSGSALSTAFWFRPIATADVLGDMNVVTNSLLGDYNNLLQDEYNPVARINDNLNPNISRSLVANAALSWNITKGLTAKTDLSLGSNWAKSKQFSGATYNNYLTTQGNKTYGGNARVRAAEGTNYRWVNTLNYEIQGLGDNHKVSVLAGTEAFKSNSEYIEVWGNRYPSSYDSTLAWANMQEYLKDPTTTYGGMSSKVNPSVTKNSYFGRANYSYKDRYLLSATFRADGSSKFAKGNQWGYFPAASAAWRISQESFMQNVNWISDVKLRLSYGEVGNDNISSGLWNQLWTPGGLTRFSLNEVQQSSYNLASSQLANYNLKWETTTTRNIGLDFALFNRRLNGTIDVYKNTVSDLLLITPVPSYIGFSSTLANIGATSNKGIEVSLSGDIVNTQDFSLKGSVNFNVNRGNVEELAPGINNTYNSGWGGVHNSAGSGDYVFEVGQPVGLVRGWVSDGMYTTADFDYNPAGGGVYTLKAGVPDIASGLLSTVYGTVGHKPGAQTAYPGVAKFKDTNKDGVVNTDDIGIIGNMNPKNTGGFSLSGNFKAFDFGMDFNWSYGNDIYNADHLNNYLGNKESGLFRNRVQELAGAYKIYDVVGGQITPVVDPAALDALNAHSTTNLAFAENTMTSSFAIEDGSYLRLNTVTIGYTIPKSAVNVFNKIRVYASVYNAFTITGYKGLDPEVSTDNSRNGNYPTPGLDYGTYPRARSYTLGVNIEF